MRAVLVVLIVMLSADSLLMIFVPAKVREWLQGLSEKEVRLIGLTEALIAALSLYVLLKSLD